MCNSSMNLQESDLGVVRIVQELNSIIASGEFPTLFTNDELDGLLQVLLRMTIGTIQ